MNRILLVLISLALILSAAHALQVSSYNVDPSPVLPGQTFTLYAYVTNETASAEQDVKFEVIFGKNSADTSFPFSIESTDSTVHSLGTIPAYTTVQVQYQVQVAPTALDGAYTVQLRAFSEKNGGAVTDAIIQILARKPVLTIVQSTPSTASIGQSVNMQLTIKNTGSSNAYDIIARLVEDRTVTAGGVIVERDIVPLGASSIFVGELAVGDSAVVNIPITINPLATSKPYFVPVTLDYYDSNRSAFTTTDYLGLKVSGEPELNAYPADATPLPQPGKMSRVSIDIFNTGLGPAKFVTAYVQSDVFVSSQSDYFIGTIESDDFDTIIMDATVASSVAPGMYPVNVTINYKNEYGDVHSFTKVVNMKVYSSSEASSDGGSSSPLPLIVGILIVAGLVWWFRFRKPQTGKGK